MLRAVWAFWDALPTFAELAGGAVSPDTDGISIVPTLLGQPQPPKDYVFHTWGSGKKTGYGVRTDYWKGVVHACGPSGHPAKDDVMELYNLRTDPFENTDVSAGNSAVVEQLRNIILPKNLSCTCFQC
jgi:arylsulfatase A-like enzyme